MKQNIIIAGYPKSGNTWIARLTSDILDCPMMGYWQDPDAKSQKKGRDRESTYRVYKSHHSLAELNSFQEKAHKIVYVVRDPRDVALSGVKYFNRLALSRYIAVKNKFLAWPIKMIDRFIFELIGRMEMKRRMMDAVLNGNENVHPWCRDSWQKHNQDFINDPNILVISYEDTLSNPRKSIEAILSHIGLEKSETELDLLFETLIENKKVTERTGGKSYWMTQMDEDEIKEFSDKIGDDMLKLGYVLN